MRTRSWGLWSAGPSRSVCRRQVASRRRRRARPRRRASRRGSDRRCAAATGRRPRLRAARRGRSRLRWSWLHGPSPAEGPSRGCPRTAAQRRERGGDEGDGPSRSPDGAARRTHQRRRLTWGYALDMLRKAAADHTPTVVRSTGGADVRSPPLPTSSADGSYVLNRTRVDGRRRDGARLLRCCGRFLRGRTQC